jgi:6-phosphogluconolactonase
MSMGPSSAGPPSLGGVSAERAFWFTAAVTTVVFLVGIYAPYFVVDSWSYLELSNSVFTDFYRYNTLRQFENPSPYSQAFPPLWPVLLAVFRRAADLGIYTGYVLNGFLCLALSAALIRLSERIALPGWVGAACYMALLGYPPFLGEALGAKTIPLALTLLTGSLLMLAYEPGRRLRVAVAALLMGLACLTRFDAIVAACVIGAAFVAREYQWRRRFVHAAGVMAIYCAILGAVLSPLAAYGMTHFGKPFPSDNTRIVMEADGGTVLDYFVKPPASDLAQHPGRWVAGLLLHKTPRMLLTFAKAAFASALTPLLAVVLVAWGASRAPRVPAPAVRFTVFALILIPLMLAPAVLVGFPDSRYLSGPMLLLFLVLFAILVSFDPAAWSPRRATLLLIVVALPLGYKVMQPLLENRGHLSLAGAMAPLSPTPEMQQVTDAVHRDSGGQTHRLILTIGNIATVKYGALTGEPTTMMPRLNGRKFADFARDWHVTHVYNPPTKSWVGALPIADPAGIMREIGTPGIELVRLDLPGLYRIRFTPEQPPALAPLAGGASAHGDYWMYVGTWTSSGEGKGIYLFKFHSATGKVEAKGTAAGRLWQSNRDALASSLPRIFGQFRAEWPSVKKMILGVHDPSYLSFHPNGRYLYTADSNYDRVGNVSAFLVDPETGKLTMLTTRSSAGVQPCFITVDITGKDLLVANFGGTVAVLPIDATGRLLDATSVVQLQGWGPDQARQPHAHSITVSPDNRFAIVTDMGRDEVLVYKFDANRGTLTANDPPFIKLSPGTTPRHFCFHPNGIFGYVIGESGSRITAMRWDGQRGAFTLMETISSLPEDFHGASIGAEVLVHPNGRFLYASNRGHDSIAVFTIDPAKGALAPVQYASAHGKRPSNFQIDPTGRYLFAANLNSSNLVQFRIDPQTGRLNPTSSFGVPTPAGMKFVQAR